MFSFYKKRTLQRGFSCPFGAIHLPGRGAVQKRKTEDRQADRPVRLSVVTGVVRIGLSRTAAPPSVRLPPAVEELRSRTAGLNGLHIERNSTGFRCRWPGDHRKTGRPPQGAPEVCPASSPHQALRAGFPPRGSLHMGKGPGCRCAAGAVSCEGDCKPGSVSDSHLSRRAVAGAFKPPPKDGRAGHLSFPRCCSG